LKALELELILIGLLLRKLGVQLPLRSEISGLLESLPHSVTFFVSRRKILLRCTCLQEVLFITVSQAAHPVMEQSQGSRILGVIAYIDSLISIYHSCN
jgi:hypothetical protein